MIRVLANDGMDPNAVEELLRNGIEVNTTHYEGEALAEKVQEYDIMTVRSATKVREPLIDKMAESGRMKLLLRGGVGIDNIDVAYAEEKGIQVKNTPLASAISVAEATLAHMLSFSRNLHLSNHTMRSGQWNKKQYEGTELYGKTIGLVGFGSIAKEVALRVHALGMTVLYTNRSGPKTEFANYAYVGMDELLERSDYVSLHTPSKAVHRCPSGQDSVSFPRNPSRLHIPAPSFHRCADSVSARLWSTRKRHSPWHSLPVSICTGYYALDSA
jgi:D-3-phosphoglycerate dehydrogenase